VFEQAWGPKETFVLSQRSVSGFGPSIECYCRFTFGLGGSCFELNQLLGLKTWVDLDASGALSDPCPITERVRLGDSIERDRVQKLMMFLENRMWFVRSLYGRSTANAMSVTEF